MKTAQKPEPKQNKQTPPRNPHGCKSCNRSFNSELGLLAHMSMKHIKTESAVQGDCDEKYKKGKSSNFLAKKNFHRKRSNSLEDGTQSKKREDQQSMSQEQNQLSMVALMMKMNETLNALAKDLRGQNLEK